MIRYDQYISYWVFLWFLLYRFRVVPYNPRMALIVLSILVTIVGCYLVYLGGRWEAMQEFILYNFLLKGVPLLFVWNHAMRPQDYTATFLVFSVYSLWMFLSHRNPLDLYTAFFIDQVVA